MGLNDFYPETDCSRVKSNDRPQADVELMQINGDEWKKCQRFLPTIR